MNYIGRLNKEEKVTLFVMLLSGKDCKQFFIRNSSVFNSIKKGFRATKITENKALLIALDNIDDARILLSFNNVVDDRIKQIHKEISHLEENGASHNTALATALINSEFFMNIELYFKLTDNVLDNDTRAAIYAEMNNLSHLLNETFDQVEATEQKNRSLTDQNLNLTKQVEAAEQKNRSLTEQNHSLTEQVDAMIEVIRSSKAASEEKVREIEKSKASLDSKLTAAQAKIAELETAAAAATIAVNTVTIADAGSGADADYLTQFDDTNTAALSADGPDEIISLCTISNLNDQHNPKELRRYADLDNGRYNTFLRDRSISPYFKNRDRLFCNDGPSDVGFYGIWNWSAIPKANDPEKDFIKSSYNKDIAAIEVVTVADVTTIDELAELLKNGIEFVPHSGKVMFTTCASGGRYTGILCEVKKLHTANGKTTISADCTVLPVYEFAGDDVLRLGNISFYRKAFAGIPNRLCYLKSQLETVKDIVLSSLSWGVYKTRNITHAQHRAFKEFVEAIPVDDITQKIVAACHCSLAAAKELLDEFLRTVDKYVDGDSLGDEIVRSAVAANASVREKAKNLVRQDWEAENAKLLSDAKGQLESLRAEQESAAGDLRNAQDALEKAKAEEARLTDSIVKKENLAAEVEQAVAARIQKARENAADFIAEMAFAGMPAVQSMPQMPARGAAVQGLPVSSSETYRVCPESDNRNELEEHLFWEDVIMATELGLGDAGVAQKYGQGLAAFLCAAYIKKQPLLLVGPNAIDIIEAFSATLCAHKHGVLCCEGSYDRQAIEKIGAAGESIVLINNLLASGWINRLPEILARKDIFYVATHPYAADIQVEPGSLYGFMLPLFTELLVDQPANGQYLGGYLAEELKEEIKTYQAPKRELPVLSELAPSLLVKNRIECLAATMHKICPNATADDDFMFCLLPIAYASMAVNKLAEKMADPQRGIVISKNLKDDLKFVLGEL